MARERGVMENSQVQPSRSRSVIGFVIVAIILIVLLLGGLYFGKKFVANMGQKTATTSKTPAKMTSTSPANKKVADNNATKKTAPSTSKSDTKKSSTPAATPQTTPPTTQTPSTTTPAPSATPPTTTTPSSSTSNPQTVANTGPSSPLPSTGPVEVVSVILGASALAYGGYTYLRSRRELSRVV
jgi:FtsZ-interacting cell division protein ZipA